MAGETKKDIEKILADDPHIQIMPTKERHLNEINYEFIKQEKRDDLKTKTIPILKEFLKTVYFADDFENHTERTAYLEELQKIHGKEIFGYYKLNNGMGFNMLTQAAMILDNVVAQEYTGPYKKELAQLMKGLRDLTEYNRMTRTYKKYRTMTNEERINLVENKKDIMAEAMQILAKQQ